MKDAEAYLAELTLLSRKHGVELVLAVLDSGSGIVFAGPHQGQQLREVLQYLLLAQSTDPERVVMPISKADA